MRWNLPNAITTGRLLLTPALFFLLFQPAMSIRLVAFGLFLAAALSDLWDGYLARRRGEETDYGKLADPIADKLLLASALVPFYLLTTSEPSLAGIPVFDRISLWILIVFLGREVLVTTLRAGAARRGSVVEARQSGKYKAVFQNLFLGATILWLALRTGAGEGDWTGPFWDAWQAFHGWFVTVSLAIALFLTVYSLAIYLLTFWRVFLREAAG